MTTDRGGVTLIELLVVLVLLGVSAGVVGLALTRAPESPEAGEVAAILARARRDAMRTGRAVTRTFVAGDTARTVTALPDGRLISYAGTRMDLLSGKPSRDSL